MSTTDDGVKATVGWFNNGQLGRGVHICGIDGTQIAVFYGPSVNPRSAADVALALAAQELLIAARRMMLQSQVRNATNNANPGMAHAADNLAVAIAHAEGRP